MSTYKITGNTPLKGTVTPAGNKNLILKLIPASLLTDETVTLTNVPRISDVRIMARILRRLGASVRFEQKGSVLKINCKKVKSHKIDPEQASKLRASNMFLGPLLARFGKVVSPYPGGDKIGPREMTAHFVGLSHLGAKLINQDRDTFTLKGELKGSEVNLYEPSVTATENTIMAAVLAEGWTKITNAACEPHVRDLCQFLNKMGTKINGIGSNVLTISGVSKLKGVNFEVSPDHVDVGTYIILGAITRGKIKITEANREDLKTILFFFKKLGVQTKFEKKDLIVNQKKPLEVKDREWGQIKGFYSQPWPCFPTDMMSLSIVLATQAKGSTLFFEKMFSGRMFFANYLNGMGANIIMCDPHRIVVNGPTKLHGQKLVTPDLRAGMAYVAAALCAEGESIIENVEHIERGYPDVVEKLKKLGAKIEKV